MRKQVKLKKKVEYTPRESGGFFSAEHVTGKALAVVTTIKMFEMILVTIFGLFLGIFAPISVFAGSEDPLPEAVRAGVFWLISSGLYIIGFFALMLGNSKIALIIHTVASVGSFITYANYQQLYADDPTTNGPAILFMPCIFITLMTLAVMLVINVPKWLDKRERKLSEKAPSILGNDDNNENDKKE